jgi:hypothetical protein
MDVHREFAQLAVVEDALVRDEGWIGVTPEELRQWAGSLHRDDEAPEALCADGGRAWYVCTPEIEMPAVDGRPGRAVRPGLAGFTAELLRLDAVTGAAERLCDLEGPALEGCARRRQIVGLPGRGTRERAKTPFHGCGAWT